jgi:hypothetical protein
VIIINLEKEICQTRQYSWGNFIVGWGSHDSVPCEIAGHDDEQQIYPRELEKGYNCPYLQWGRSISNWKPQTGQFNISGLQINGACYSRVPAAILGNE